VRAQHRQPGGGVNRLAARRGAANPRQNRTEREHRNAVIYRARPPLLDGCKAAGAIKGDKLFQLQRGLDRACELYFAKCEPCFAKGGDSIDRRVN
jgi:hypothetical protein